MSGWSPPTGAAAGPRAVVVVLATLLAAVALGCGTPGAPDTAGPGAARTGAWSAEVAVPTVAATPAPALPVTVTGADGRTVTVSDAARIVPLQGDLAEIVFALGLGERVVARDVSATFVEADDLPLVTRAHDVSAESVLAVRPTVVLADTETGPAEAIDHLRNVGVPVVVFERATEVAEIGQRIEAVAAALGVAEAGRALADRTRAEIAAVTDEVPDGPAPRVAFLYLRGQAGVALIGGAGSGADSMITAAGGIDAGTALGLDRAFTPITPEALVGADPDVLLLTTTGLESVGGIEGLAEMPGIAQTRAGAERRVVTVEDGLLFSFGTRTPAALRELVADLHAAAP